MKNVQAVHHRLFIKKPNCYPPSIDLCLKTAELPSIKKTFRKVYTGLIKTLLIFLLKP
ncbi:hypothetical protein TPE_0489 [Treponema pedis str. T A4]|uniref:Uncharacterized protein n=1 Tax=Treponema pedis str. T A4 TaxID=1291379 RepID=S5ZSC5_9SPIR|nr:hypothetical protein TPE_0489 [Treponema pedis str. T A4]